MVMVPRVTFPVPLFERRDRSVVHVVSVEFEHEHRIVETSNVDSTAIKGQVGDVREPIFVESFFEPELTGCVDQVFKSHR